MRSKLKIKFPPERKTRLKLRFIVPVKRDKRGRYAGKKRLKISLTHLFLAGSIGLVSGLDIALIQHDRIEHWVSQIATWWFNA